MRFNGHIRKRPILFLKNIADMLDDRDLEIFISEFQPKPHIIDALFRTKSVVSRLKALQFLRERLRRQLKNSLPLLPLLLNCRT